MSGTLASSFISFRFGTCCDLAVTYILRFFRCGSLKDVFLLLDGHLRNIMTHLVVHFVVRAARVIWVERDDLHRLHVCSGGAQPGQSVLGFFQVLSEHDWGVCSWVLWRVEVVLGASIARASSLRGRVYIVVGCDVFVHGDLDQACWPPLVVSFYSLFLLGSSNTLSLVKAWVFRFRINHMLADQTIESAVRVCKLFL